MHPLQANVWLCTPHAGDVQLSAYVNLPNRISDEKVKGKYVDSSDPRWLEEDTGHRPAPTELRVRLTPHIYIQGMRGQHGVHLHCGTLMCSP